MSNQTLKELSARIHDETHATPNETHGFTDEDVMNAAILLHAIVMDVGADYLQQKVGQDMAEVFAHTWGQSLHDQILVMTGVDTHEAKL